LGDNGVERALLILPLFLVLLIELLNGAVETVVDRIGTEHNELSGRAKDLASAAVFVALVTVPAVWGLVLLG
jgi:diacylglycerol kinase (ATP)